MLLRVVCGAALGSTFQTLVKRSHNQFSDRCFATTGPTLWNRQSAWTASEPDITFRQFKRSLKKYMFG